VEILFIGKVLIAALWRRKIAALASFLVVVVSALSVYMLVGKRYEAEALLLVGNGIGAIGERSGLGSVVDPTGINSLARIAETEDVVRGAATKVGFERLFADLDPAQRKEGTLLSMLRRSMSVHAERKSDVLKISFRHRDAVIAAEFVNALSDSLIVRHADLLSVPGSVLDVQRKRLEEDVQQAASKLERLSSIYSISEQRTLLLKQASELAGSIISTRGSIVDREAQKEVLTDHLLMLQPVTQSPFVSGIVRSLGTKKVRSGSRVESEQAEEQPLVASPPLLLVRTYQDAMASLFKINAELAGARNLETHLIAELQNVNKELAALSSKEAEYNRLNRELKLAVTAAESYAKRVIEEQINANFANSRVSSVRIAQLANTPEGPAFPQLTIFLVFGVVGGVVLALAVALFPEALARMDGRDPVSRCPVSRDVSAS
jgi:polysaccharide biosynthesis transport protein